MSIRISGLASGMDTDSIVKSLSSAYQVKIDKVAKKKKKTEWQKEAWEDMNKKIMSLYKGTLAKMKTYGSYKAKKATVTGGTENSVSVTATNNASAGSYKMKVISSASSAFLTGASLAEERYTATYDATNATLFKDMKDSSGKALDLSGKKLTFSGTEYENKKVDGEEVFTLKDAGGSAVSIDLYDENGLVTGQTTEATKAQIDAYLNKKAEDPSFNKEGYKTENVIVPKQGGPTTFTYEFTESSSIADINKALKEQGFTGLTASMKDGTIQFSNTAGFTKNEDGSIKDSMATYSVEGDALNELGIDKSAIEVKNEATQGDDGKYTYNSSVSGTKNLTYDVADTKLSGKSKVSQYLGTDSAEFNLVMGSGDSIAIKIDENTTMDQLAKQIADASGGKITASFDATNQRFFFSSSATGAENDFKFEASASDPNSEAALKKLGLMDDGQRGDESTEDYEKRRMSKQDATDAQIELNGAFLTSKNNNIVVDALGITIDVTNGKSGDEMTIGVSRDTDAAYNVIKDFVKEYNNLITEMNEKYRAKSTGYEPLTEDEEAQLTETQLKQWEEKAKADLLSRDDRLNSIITNMRSILASSVSITKDDGSVGKFSLSSFGIVTGNYTEYGLLHIQGDEDDPDYADKTNKLKEALEKDPDRVMNTFAEIGTKLYDKITKMTDASNRTVRSYGNIYDDKTYTNKIDDYEDEIEKLQKRLEEIQDKYYKQFSAMEVAMSKVNATASQLGFTPLTGGGQ